MLSYGTLSSSRYTTILSFRHSIGGVKKRLVTVRTIFFRLLLFPISNDPQAWKRQQPPEKGKKAPACGDFVVFLWLADAFFG